MASEDVIELGSSDDEAEPAAKKIKPPLNAMVHIPRKLHDVTIKPAKLNTSSSIPKELAGKNVTVTKISKSVNDIIANQYAVKNKINGKPFPIKQAIPKQVQHKIPQKITGNLMHIPKKPVAIQNKASINPLSIMKNINSQVVINKVSSAPKMLKNAIKIHSPRAINNLPPSITVTRTAGALKRAAPATVVNAVRKKQKKNNMPKDTGEVLTVDLDDDEVSSSSTASPQWYLRPEEQTNVLEEENNKEPEPCKSSVENEQITIEDSPIKPIKDKRAKVIVNEEFTVTIDDSPVKTIAEKNTASGSDGEAKVVNKVPHSKKKLEYPKEAERETEVVSDVVEIEISPIPTEETKLEEVKTAESYKLADTVIEIEESPLKVEGQGTSTPKKNHPAPQLAVPDSIKELQVDNKTVQEADDLNDFNPVYQSFIRLCFQLENSEDMKKIVEKKIKTYYRQVPKEYTESEEFIDMVAGKVLAMKAGPEKMYLYIKDIVDELNLQRKMAKSQVLSNLNKKESTESEKYLYGADSEYDSKRQRQIRKLEKTLKKLHRAIQKLEEQEVDFDDDEDSVYLLTESDEGSTSNKNSDRQLEKDPKVLLQRYKERMVRVHAKFCQLTNTKMPSEPRVQIDARPGQATGPAKKLEKWINKKVPIGTPLPFPDFHDVLRCVREANDEDKLGWNEADIMEEARDLFTRCGKKLQRRRQENEWRLAASRISVEVDPAEQSQALMRQLDDNKKIAAKKEAEVFNKYADRQSQLKLEAEEIGDKEAEESPGDDDEDEEPEPNNEPSLENKEKRKERLKRLLHEKSKKIEDTQKVLEVNNIKKDALENEKDRENQTSGNINSPEGDTHVKNVNNLENQEGKEDNQIESESKQDDVDMVAISENKDVSENESVKTIESDTVEIVTNDKETGKSETKETSKVSEDLCTETNDNGEKTHSISDDSNKLESDVDELHLLQKLHSGNEVNSSTVESTDSETPIAISDTLGSSSDSKKRASSDIISIENSSYSESEINKEPSDSTTHKLIESTYSIINKVVDEIVDANTELECSNVGIEKKQVRTNNDEYNESVEDILLASTDDEEETDKSVKSANNDECVNLKDDSISIGDTVVEGVDKSPSTGTRSPSRKQDDVSSVDSISCVSLKDDSPAEPNMVTAITDVENVLTETPNTEDENENTEIVGIEQSEDINSLESENSIQSVHTVDLKESSSEKEMDTQCSHVRENAQKDPMDTVQECVLDSAKENSAEELMDTNEESTQNSTESESLKETVIESMDTLSGAREDVVTEEISDTPEERTDVSEGEQKFGSPKQRLTNIDDSVSNLVQEQAFEPSKDTISNKL